MLLSRQAPSSVAWWIFSPGSTMGLFFLPYHWKVIRCQSFRLGGVFQSTVQGMWSLGDGSAKLELPSASTPNPGAVRQCLSCGLHQPLRGHQVSCSLEEREVSQIISWMKTPCPVISAFHIPGINNWKVYYHICQHLHQGKWAYL